ncbi:Uncharacterized protein conserved in bacteria [Klebsiella pneumoniae]|nr:Uncharacterized protein conserved in bacteria [Klebsiella pneumoniae]
MFLHYTVYRISTLFYPQPPVVQRRRSNGVIIHFISDCRRHGLSVEAGLLGPLASQVGDLWATMSIFGIGAVLTFFLMLFFSPRSSPSFFSLPGWQLTGGLLGAGYVVILTMATPVIGIAMTMIGILAGQVAKSLAIDHYGLFGSPRRKIDPRRAMALMLIMAALLLVALG